MKWLIPTVALAVCVGCGEVPPSTTSPAIPSSTSPSTDAPATNNPENPTTPDNTGINQRDADGATKTPIDQDENQADVSRTAEIRQRIVAEPDLSINARNAKVITSAGKVTLRGPVASANERDILVRIATTVAGEGNVDNQLEIAP